MLKITESSKKLTLKVFRAGNNDVIRGDSSDKVDEIVKDFSTSKKLKN